MANKKLGYEYISTMCMELHLIANAGISYAEGLAILGEDEKDDDAKKALAALSNEIDEGKTISEAFETVGAFPDYMVNMLKIGEQTGNLDKVFRSLSDYYARQKSITDAVSRAFTFPAVLFVMTLAVIGVLIIQVLPIFNEVFIQLGATMSPIALAFMNAGMAINSGRYIILGVIIALIAIAAATYFVPPMRNIFNNIKTSITNMTRLGNEISSARFSAAMTMAISSGLDADSAIEIASRLSKGTNVEKKADECRDLLNQGISFGECVNKVKLFEPLYCHMLAIGIKTGTSETVMDEIARRSEQKVNDSIERTISRIEPVFIVIMSVLIGLVLLSVMLPMMGIMSSIG